ncbi:hypothetical protein LTR70_001055 [Exophiala xenobiotica]|uniref:Uncharacterized protein n=1 Tax=Lithohypha guttulata TaxID=1690604 RepID=A0ABR0KMV8_9EURO|nr:hypothetical protein LTR24_000756 [Lithohypha guttulata]KAK5328901.1 hypothetical protein LTR70_001055 [Exophiala xenobiotica]
MDSHTFEPIGQKRKSAVADDVVSTRRNLETQDPVTHLPEPTQARAAPKGEKVGRQELVEVSVLARRTSESQPHEDGTTPPKRCR